MEDDSQGNARQRLAPTGIHDDSHGELVIPTVVTPQGDDDFGLSHLPPGLLPLPHEERKEERVAR